MAVYIENDTDDNELWEVVEDEAFIQRVESAFSGNSIRLSTNFIAKIRYDDEFLKANGLEPENNYVVELYGGKNGDGDFQIYLSEILNMCKKLIENDFRDIVLMDWTNDVPDDVFTFRFLLKDK